MIGYSFSNLINDRRAIAQPYSPEMRELMAEMITIGDPRDDVCSGIFDAVARQLHQETLDEAGR